MLSLPTTLVGLVLVLSCARTEGATVVGKGEYAARITPLGYPNILPQFQVRIHIACVDWSTRCTFAFVFIFIRHLDNAPILARL